MRITRPSLALSLVLLAGPALAQGGPGMQQNQPQTPQDRYELVPSQQGPMQYEQQTQRAPGQQGMMQGQMPQNMKQHRAMMQQMHSGMMHGMQSGTSGRQMGQTAPGIVSFATRGKIKQSLEQSGFKDVQVVPQAYLIRAEAPDGSRIVMQVSPEGLSGVVFEQQEGSGGSTGQQNH